MEETEVFNKRAGTTDEGKEYEDVVLASVLLDLVNDPSVKYFNISSNDGDYGAFDDLIIKLESDKMSDEVRVKAIQLKHTQNTQKRKLSTDKLRQENGDFSIKKYFKTFQKTKKPVDEFILFTNRLFKYEKDAKFQFGEGLHIKPVKSEDSLKLSDETSEVYQFEIVEDNPTVENIQEYKNFFGKFYLYTNQYNLEKLKNATANKFRATYPSSENLFSKFIETISAWNMQEGKKETLNKIWTQRVISLQLLSPQIKLLSFGSVNDKMKIFREAISLFDIALFEKESSETIKLLWGDVRENENIEKLNQVRKRYLPAVSNIDKSNVSSIGAEALSLLLWLTGKCPLILVDCKNFEEVIQLWPDAKFVLIGQSKNGEWMKKYSVFQNLSHLSKKQDLSKKLMQEFTVSIQGKDELDLVTAFGSDEGSLQNVTTDTLVEMVNGPCHIRVWGQKICTNFKLE